MIQLSFFTMDFFVFFANPNVVYSCKISTGILYCLPASVIVNFPHLSFLNDVSKHTDAFLNTYILYLRYFNV